MKAAGRDLPAEGALDQEAAAVVRCLWIGPWLPEKALAKARTFRRARQEASVTSRFGSRKAHKAKARVDVSRTKTEAAFG